MQLHLGDSVYSRVRAQHGECKQCPDLESVHDESGHQNAVTKAAGLGSDGPDLKLQF